MRTNAAGQPLPTNNNFHPPNGNNGESDAEEENTGTDGDLSGSLHLASERENVSCLNPSLRESSSIVSGPMLPGPVGRITNPGEPETISRREDNDSELPLDPLLRELSDISSPAVPSGSHNASPNEDTRSLQLPFPERPPQTWETLPHVTNRGIVTVTSEDIAETSEPNAVRCQRQRRPPKPKEVVPIVCQEWLQNNYLYLVDANLGPVWLECMEDWLKFERNLPLSDISSVGDSYTTTILSHIIHLLY